MTRSPLSPIYIVLVYFTSIVKLYSPATFGYGFLHFTSGPWRQEHYCISYNSKAQSHGDGSRSYEGEAQGRHDHIQSYISDDPRINDDKMSLNTTESINSTSYTQTTAYTGHLTEDKMPLNTTESINSTSYTQTTAYTGHLTEGETIALIATVTVALFLLLLSSGGIFYCISKRHKATLELDGRRGTIFEPFGRESWQTRSSRESGAYKSFDIISLDILKDTTTENRPVSLPENVDIQRISKGSTLSGAYRSFDDLENAQPDPRTQDYEGDRLENRISLSDFEGPVKRTTYVQSDQDKRHSFHDQSDNSSGVETLGRYDSKEKLGNSELLQDTLREIDNPLFSELFHFDH